jgi:hypothetical protein
MLNELEASWLSLEQQLLAYLAVQAPDALPEVRYWLQLISMLPIPEKTMYFAELCEPMLASLATHHEQEEWQEVKTSLMAGQQFKDPAVFQLFERSMDEWVHLSREKGGRL